MTAFSDVEKARDLALAHIRAAAAILGAVIVEQEAVPDSPCTDREPSGAVSVAARAWLRRVPGGAAVATLHDRWAAEGCSVLVDGRGHPLPTVLVQRPDDLFWLRAMVNPQGELFVTVSSPCIRP